MEILKSLEARRPKDRPRKAHPCCTLPCDIKGISITFTTPPQPKNNTLPSPSSGMSFVHLDNQKNEADSPRYSQRSSSIESSLFKDESNASAQSSTANTSATAEVAHSDATKKRNRVMEIFCKQLGTRNAHGALYFQNVSDYGTYIEQAEDIVQALISNVSALSVARAEQALEQEKKTILSENKHLIKQMQEESRAEHALNKRKALEEPTWGVALDDELTAEQKKLHVVDLKRARIYRERDETVHRNTVDRKKPLTRIQKERMMGYDRTLSQRRAKTELINTMQCFPGKKRKNGGGGGGSISKKEIDGKALFYL